MRWLVPAAILCAATLWSSGLRAQAPATATDGPRYAASGELMRPADYREWVYLSSGLNMTYGANAPNPARNQPFNNVFVNRSSYRAFLETGRWPDKTIFILEIRRSEEHVRPNAFGYTQAAVGAIEAAVKDSRNGAQPWAYYSFNGRDGLAASATPLPESAGCQACHSTHTAVEQTFVQFYPTLFEVAKAKGTVKPTWSPLIEPQAAPASR
jgi:hypothetical protein